MTKGCSIYAQTQAITVKKDALRLNFNKNVKCKNGFICGIELTVRCLNDDKIMTDITTTDTNNNNKTFDGNESEKEQKFEKFDNNNNDIDKMVDPIDKMVDTIDATVDTIDAMVDAIPAMRDSIESTNEARIATDKLSDDASEATEKTIVPSYKTISCGMLEKCRAEATVNPTCTEVLTMRF